MYTKKQRKFAMLACIAIILVTFFSFLFLVKEVNHCRFSHHCTERECPICASIEVAEEMVRGFGAAAIFVAITMIIPILSLFVCKVVPNVSLIKHTLISQKVRLND